MRTSDRHYVFDICQRNGTQIRFRLVRLGKRIGERNATAAPAGLTCLNEVAAGSPVDALSSNQLPRIRSITRVDVSGLTVENLKGRGASIAIQRSRFLMRIASVLEIDDSAYFS